MDRSCQGQLAGPEIENDCLIIPNKRNGCFNDCNQADLVRLVLTSGLTCLFLDLLLDEGVLVK